MSGVLFFFFSQLPLVQGQPIAEPLPYLNNAKPRLILRADTHTEFAPAWVSEPDIRGTFRLLYSCLFTLTLCVYTAIHLNVPRRRETGLELFWRKLKWVIVAIFAPELVLYAAYVQWHVASDMCKSLNGLAETKGFTGRRQGDDDDAPGDKHDLDKPHRFSLLYGYYVVMGGLVMDIRNLHDECTQVTLTPEGLLYLAQNGHFIFVSDDTIKDKSKSDAFAKVIVMLQVTWMIVQTCSRLAAGLPVTIIEGHTLVHVVTALAMYTLWFQKPLNICEPTIVENQAFMDHTALMLMRSTRLGGKACASTTKRSRRLSLIKGLIVGLLRLIGLKDVAQDKEDAYLKLDRLTHRSDDTSESAYLKNYLATVDEVKKAKEKKVILRRDAAWDQPFSIPLVQNPKLPEVSTQEGSGIAAMPPEVAPDTPNKPIIYDAQEVSVSDIESAYKIPLPEGRKPVGVIKSGQRLASGIGPIEANNMPTFSMRISDLEGSNTHSLSIELSPKIVRRWEQAAKVIEKEHVGIEEAACYLIDGQPSNLPLPDEQGIKSIGTSNIFWLVVVFFILCTGYGGVHCIAWNSDFATNVELQFWRFACIDLVIAGVLYFLLFAFYLATEEGSSSSSVATTSRWTVLVVGWGHFAVYIAARVFLVVEAFMSVRHLRVGAYEVVDWAAFIPHL
ncbi:hypothetical protein FZEAL_3564 [Fusarium zealandicum]|uniref:Uncharacterized protein n=1 Tax=Fusarium zealandicum TaxID=1053134 RepID=A0A8H4UNI5_9HYPO|nr:hypothetical protein FZEAL_3564 [Fusarium zealandicum]